MKFLSILEETNHSKKINRIRPFDEDISLRKFKGIKKGNVSLSIQASHGHYCTPRKTFSDLSEYSSMEFALVDESGEFVRVKDILPNFPKLKEIEEHWDIVYRYVPVNLIEELYRAYFA